jgi:iron complex outermembrane recepter protein
MQGVVVSKLKAAIVLICGCAPHWVLAQDADVFALGRITVTGVREQEAIDDPLVTADEVWSFDRNTLDEAVKIIPGVTANLDSNGRRNEHDILVRGFGRWQVPLSIDGIRIYLPADNRLDFARFLTQDLAEIQVQKGYVSVLDGPGGMGGAINLVTRKPTKEFETHGQSGATFDNDESFAGWSGFASVGTRQDSFYAQASASYLDRDHWRVSDDFRRTAIEDGGDRNRSSNRDERLNAKIGFTPNDSNEYSLSFTSQSGRKGAPLNVYNNPPNPPNSYWDWPYWDIKNVYFLSNTAIGEASYLKGRAFYNTFDNALWAYDDATYTTQSLNGRFRSVYADTGYGGSLERGTQILDRNMLKAALHYRRDEHTERNFNRPTNATFANTEPKQRTEEDTWSVAVEDTFALTDVLDLIAGVSYERNELNLAQEFNASAGLLSTRRAEVTR